MRCRPLCDKGLEPTAQPARVRAAMSLSDSQDSRHLLERVRLYLKVMLLLDLLSEGSGVVFALLDPQLSANSADFPSHFPVLRWGTLLVLVSSFGWARLGRPGPRSSWCGPRSCRARYSVRPWSVAPAWRVWCCWRCLS